MSKSPTAAKPAENALARQALDKIKQIDRDATAAKGQQLQLLSQAKDAIQARISELLHQQEEIDDAIACITGKKTEKGKKERRKRADLSEVRARVVRWLQTHKGTRYSATQLLQEFPELAEGGIKVSLLLKSPVENKELNTEGQRAGLTYAAV